MMTLVVYDISDDRLRTAVESKCKNYGLKHIQRSVFIGILSRGDRLALYQELLDIVREEGSVRIYVMNKRLYGMRMAIGRIEGFDEDPDYGEDLYVQA